MQVKLAETSKEVEQCYPVMAQLRPHLGQEETLSVINFKMAVGLKKKLLQDGGTRCESYAAHKQLP